MEPGDLIGIVGFILYILYSIITAGGKKKKKTPPLQPPVTPSPKKRKKRVRRHQLETVEETQTVVIDNKRVKTPAELKREIEKRLKRLQEEQKRKELVKPLDTHEYDLPVEQVYEEEESDEFIPERLEQTKYFDYDHQKVVRTNLDDSPKTHKDDEHFVSRSKRKKKGLTVGKSFKFNAKQAIIYKEIMERKYFDV